MIRAVIDTNTLISGMFWDGVPWHVYQAALDERFILVSSTALLNELRSVLERPKFLTALNAIEKTAEQIVATYQTLSVIIEPAEIPLDAVRDRKDQALIAAAVGGKANFLISGDKDLLVLRDYKGTIIVNARQFLEHLSSES